MINLKFDNGHEESIDNTHKEYNINVYMWVSNIKVKFISVSTNYFFIDRVEKYRFKDNKNIDILIS